VLISTSGTVQRVFDTPYAVSVVGAEELRAAGPLVNLSEALSRVPGLNVSNRHNAAQDLQISSRGFGARASFGVRGLRLYADGIPASGPDGQGQVSHFDLAGASRIEVLRGPFSALYGSSSGGVISLVSSAPTQRELLLDADRSSQGLQQVRIGLTAPLDHGWSLRAQVSQLQLQGFRPQSRSERLLGNVRLARETDADQVLLVLNTLRQPALDPLGLTRAQLQADPLQTQALALPQATPGQAERFNTRKDTAQEQAGVRWRHRFADAGALRESQVMAYRGTRSVTQWQSIPVGTQFNAANPALTERQSGGVIDFDRVYQGLDARLRWRWPLVMGSRQDTHLAWVIGAALDGTREERRGFENFSGEPATRLLGVSGRLRRDESNRLQSRDVYTQAEIGGAGPWAATLGWRGGRLNVVTQDRYVVGANGDDSGRLAYRYSNPVLAVQWKPGPEFQTYVSAGRGFEAPTLGELAYRPDGQTGFNSALRPQTSRQIELGAKWRPADTGALRQLSLDGALFQARSEDEIGVAANSGGRASFRNVGRTLRRGIEVSFAASLPAGLRTQLSATWLDASYRDSFTVCASLPCSAAALPVPAGNRIAGTTAGSAYAELAWTALPGLELAAELRAQGRLPVNDLGSDHAAGFALWGLRLRWQSALPLGRLDLLARIDNLSDRRGAGSVIVNESNGRFFEPLAPRALLLSARWRLPF